MSEDNDRPSPEKVFVVPEARLEATEKIAYQVEEVDAIVEIGDMVEMTTRSEVIEKRGNLIITRKNGKSKRQSPVDQTTLDDLENKLPRARR